MHAFWEHGYHETSVDDLVILTGGRPGSLYNAFPQGKRGLFPDTLARYSRLVVPETLGDLERRGAGLAELRARVLRGPGRRSDSTRGTCRLPDGQLGDRAGSSRFGGGRWLADT